MGMLDDAIREHLALRRLRGVDADELAREEEAAFGESGDQLADEPGDDVWGEGPRAVASARVRPGIAVGVGAPQEALYASQETAEIDMSAILGIEADDEARGVGAEAGRDLAVPVSAGVANRTPSLESELDRLDWEVTRNRPLAGRTHRDVDLGR